MYLGQLRLFSHTTYSKDSSDGITRISTQNQGGSIPESESIGSIHKEVHGTKREF